MVRVLLVPVASILLAAAGDRCAAEVVFTGSVWPGSPAEVTAQSLLRIGYPMDGQISPDPRGRVVVDGSSELIAGGIEVGASSNALASLVVSGPEAKVGVLGSSSPTLSVAGQGAGRVRVENGAWIDVGGDPSRREGIMTVGVSRFGNNYLVGPATVDVTGDSSLLSVGESLTIGPAPGSRLLVTDGGAVQIGHAFTGIGQLLVEGMVEVRGEGSLLQANRVDIGVSDQGFGLGHGSLIIGQSALARGPDWFRGNMRIGQQGRLILEGGIAAFSIEQMAGTIEGNGDLYGNVQVSNTGAIIVGPNQKLTVHGGIDLAGDIEVSGGVFDLLGSSRQHWWREGSTLRVEQGQVALYGEHDIRGRVELFDSSLDFQSDVFSSTQLVMQDSQLATGESSGGFGNNGTIEILPGTSVIGTSLGSGAGTVVVRSQARLEVGAESLSERQSHFLGDLVLESDAQVAFYGSTSIFTSLTIELAASNLEQPSLTVDSYLGAGGSLLIESELMGEIEAGQVYELIESDWLQIGFNDYTLPELPGTLEFLPVQTDTSLALRVIDSRFELPGDFNNDLRVDAADYTLWRDGLPGGQFELDRLVWRKNYGRFHCGRCSNAVPEPTTLAPAVIACLAARRFRRVAEVGQVGG